MTPKAGAEKQSPGIGKGTPGPGRKKGVPNKTTTLIKEAVIMAAERVGADGEGRDGLIGYMMFLAANEAPSFATLIGKVLPTQIEGTGQNGEIVFQTIYEVAKPTDE